MKFKHYRFDLLAGLTLLLVATLSIGTAQAGSTANLFYKIATPEALPDPRACPVGAYVYPAKVSNVYDADTLTADIDLGFKHWMMDQKVRFLRIDAPELRGETRRAGIESRDWVRQKVLGKTVLIATRGKTAFDNFGRALSEVYEITPGLDGPHCHNLNDQLVEAGLARYREY